MGSSHGWCGSDRIALAEQSHVRSANHFKSKNTKAKLKKHISPQDFYSHISTCKHVMWAYHFRCRVLQIKFNYEVEWARHKMSSTFERQTWWGFSLADMLLGILIGSSSSSLARFTIWPSPASSRKTSDAAPEETPMLLLLNLLEDCSCMDFKCSCLAYKRMFKLQPGQLQTKIHMIYQIKV